MRSNRWLCVTLICTSALWAYATAQEVRAELGTELTPIQTPEQILSALTISLRNPGNRTEDQLKRDEAAQKLINGYLNEGGMPQLHDAALATLINALRDPTNEGAQRAVANAIAADGETPPPVFAPVLLNLLGRNRTLSEAAADALTRYASDEQIISALTSFIKNQQPGFEASRAAVIRAMGRIIDKRVAGALMQLLTNDSNALIQDATTEALGGISSLNYGHDTARWSQWWEPTRSEPDALWRQRQIARRADLLPVTERKFDELVTQVRLEMSARFNATPDAQKPTVLMGYLKNNTPVFRAEGARLLSEWFFNGNPPTDALKAQLRLIIGDIDPQVRIEVAKTLGYINDTEALAALLNQLETEREPEVQGAIARSLGPMHDLRAVPALLQMLTSPSYRVAEAAASALADPTMSAAIRHDAKLQDQLFNAVTSVIRERTNRPGAESLREALTKTLGNMHDSRALDELRRLSLSASPQNTARVRRAAVHGLGEIEDPPGMSGQVTVAAAEHLAGVATKDPDPGVQLDAVQALKKVGTFTQTQQLFELLGPRGHGPVDPAVSKETWILLTQLFQRPEASVDQLDPFLDRLRREFPDIGSEEQANRELVVQKAIAKKLIANNDLARLAGVNQNIGELYLRLNKPDDATPYYRNAYDYHLQQRSTPAVLNPLIRKYEQVLLQSKKYDEALLFANERMKADARNQELLDEEIVRETERLVAARDYVTARDLVVAVKSKLDPVLAGAFMGRFERLQQQIPLE